MEKRRVDKYLGLFLALFLWIGMAGAFPIQVGQFYFTTTPEIANKLDPDNGSATFIFRWEIDNNGLSNQLRISTSLNPSEKYVTLGINSSFVHGEWLDVRGKGHNGVLYHFSLSDKDRNGFLLELAMPDKTTYIPATNTVGFIRYIGEDGATTSSPYYPNREVYITMAANHIASQISDLMRQQKDFGVQQLDLSRQQVPLATKLEELSKQDGNLIKQNEALLKQLATSDPQQKIDIEKQIEDLSSQHADLRKQLDIINLAIDDLVIQQKYLARRQLSAGLRMQELEETLKRKKAEIEAQKAAELLKEAGIKQAQPEIKKAQ